MHSFITGATGIDVTKMKMSGGRCLTPEKVEKRALLRISRLQLLWDAATTSSPARKMSATAANESAHADSINFDARLHHRST